MIISGTILKNAVEKYRRTHLKKEGYTALQSANAGASAAFASFSLVVAVIFLLLELLVLFYAISIALSCSQGGPQKIVHLVLAVTFTLPYMLFSVFFSECANKTLTTST